MAILFLRRREEAQAKRRFLVIGWPAVKQAIEELNAFRGIGPRLHIRPGGQALDLLHHKRAIHQEQRLLRHGSGKPLRAMRIRTGEIKDAQHPRQVLAIDVPINGTTPYEWIFELINGWAAHSKVDVASYRQQRIAK